MKTNPFLKYKVYQLENKSNEELELMATEYKELENQYVAKCNDLKNQGEFIFDDEEREILHESSKHYTCRQQLKDISLSLGKIKREILLREKHKKTYEGNKTSMLFDILQENSNFILIQLKKDINITWEILRNTLYELDKLGYSFTKYTRYTNNQIRFY